MKRSWWERFKLSSAHTQANIVCTALIMLATIAYAGIAGIQLVLIKRQIAIMQGTLEETKQSGKVSTEQMWRAIDGVRWMAQSADWSQKVTQKGVESSEQQSNKTLDANIAISRQDQRAWLGAQDYAYTIGESGPIHGSALVTNSGRSPAIEISCKITGTTKIKDDILRESDIVYPKELPVMKAGTLFPNTHVPLVAGGTAMDPEKQKIWFTNVQSGAWIQYFFGEIQYKDVFGKIHWTHFCTSYVPETKSGTPCAIYNETDDQEHKRKTN